VTVTAGGCSSTSSTTVIVYPPIVEPVWDEFAVCQGV
jgi:hypothetical protein